MSDRRDYFDRAEGWATDTRALAARSRRTAWTISGIAVAIAAFQAVALAMLVPLKTVQPITLLVDRQTGYVQALDPLTPKRVAADEALTIAYLAQYIAAREGFDRATVAVDYRRVALWSTGRARNSYLAQMPATNPESPFQRYPGGTIVQATVKSVSRLSAVTALVRFDTQAQDTNGRIEAAQPWIALVRFRFTDAPMRFDDRLVNPLGFQVTGYRRDAEAPQAPAALQPAIAATAGSASQSVVTTTTVFGPASASTSTSARRLTSERRRTRVGSDRHSNTLGQGQRSKGERLNVPTSIPRGSPLSPARDPATASQVEGR